MGDEDKKKEEVKKEEEEKKATEELSAKELDDVAGGRGRVKPGSY